MRTWLVLLAAAAVGTGIGYTRTYLEKRQGANLFFSEDFWARARAEAVVDTPTVDLVKPAKVEIDGDPVFDFGSMERYSKMKHTFRLKSVGQSDLKLTPRRTTCKCTLSDINNLYPKPGQVSEITVEWTGQTMMDSPDFVQTVEVGTNDPDQPVLRLRIKGYVTETIRALPSELVLGIVSSNTGAQARFALFGFRSDHLEVLETTWDETDIAQYFDVSYEPLTPEMVAREKGASCGLLATVTAKPGLPLGPINQTIHIRAKADKEAAVDLPVKGETMSDIRLASSPGVFNPHSNLLKIGAIKRAEGATAVLQLYVTGDHRHETQISVGEVKPAEYLKVSIGPPKELNSGKTIQYLVTVEVPPGLAPENHMGGDQAPVGRIVLETTHPQTKQIPIRVKFSVE
jgi:hypothetical protein